MRADVSGSMTATDVKPTAARPLSVGDALFVAIVTRRR